MGNGATTAPDGETAETPTAPLQDARPEGGLSSHKAGLEPTPDALAGTRTRDTIWAGRVPHCPRRRQMVAGLDRWSQAWCSGGPIGTSVGTIWGAGVLEGVTSTAARRGLLLSDAVDIWRGVDERLQAWQRRVDLEMTPMAGAPSASVRIWCRRQNQLKTSMTRIVVVRWQVTSLMIGRRTTEQLNRRHGDERPEAIHLIRTGASSSATCSVKVRDESAGIRGGDARTDWNRHDSTRPRKTTPCTTAHPTSEILRGLGFRGGTLP